MIYVTETLQSAHYLKPLLPNHQVLAWEDWVFERLPRSELTPSQRLKELTSWLPSESKHRAEMYLFSIEKLRESLILTHDHVDYCFTLLPSTPKNVELRDMFHRYLDSALRLDWTEKAWQWIELVKNGELKFEKGPYVFVSCVESTYLFTEAFNALSQKPGIELSWAKERCEPSNDFKYALGHPTGLIDDIVRNVSNSAASHPDQPIWIGFQGTPSTKTYLKLALAQAKMKYSDLTPSESQDSNDNFLSELLNQVRSASTIDLKRRLEISSGLLIRRNSLRKSISMTELVEWGVFTESEAVSLAQSRPVEAQKGTQQVRIVPLDNYLHLLKAPLFVYYDDSWSRPVRLPFVIEENEVEALHFGGFHLPRYSQLISDRAALVGELAQRPESPTYTYSPLVSFSGTPVSVEVPARARHSYSENWELSLSPKSLSATQLETYARCPALYLFSNKLKLRPERAAWESKFPLLFGIAMHEALEQFFLNQKQFKTESEPVLREYFSQALSQAEPHLKSSHPLFVLLTKNFERVSGSLLELENQLQIMFGDRTRHSIEQEFEIEIEGLKVRGKIDRIDKTDEGNLIVLDYKTGNVTFSPAHVSRGEHFQALVYLLAALKENHNTAGFLFYDLKKPELRRGILREELVSKEAKKAATRGHTLNEDAFGEWVQSGTAQMQLAAQKIQKGIFTPSPSNQTCDYCDFTNLCRVGAGHA